MRVLLTGVAGFLGSHVADHLLAAGHEVVGLDDLSGGFRQNVPQAVEFVEGDIGDENVVGEIFARARFDAVFHLAAYAAEGLSHFVKRFNYQNNLGGSVNLLTHAINHECRLFLFTSSIAVYGGNQVPMREDMVPVPEDPYGIAKLAFEQELRASRAMFGIDYVIFRPHNVYGERQNIADRYRNVVGIFMRQAIRDEPLTIFGDGEQTRAFSHVDDVAPVIATSMDRPQTWNETYNIGADTPYRVMDIAEEVSSALDKPLRLNHLPARHEVVHAHADHTKVRRAFELEEGAVDLRHGIGRMARWVRARGLPAATSAPTIEIPKNLPKGWEPS